MRVAKRQHICWYHAFLLQDDAVKQLEILQKEIQDSQEELNKIRPLYNNQVREEEDITRGYVYCDCYVVKIFACSLWSVDTMSSSFYISFKSHSTYVWTPRMRDCFGNAKEFRHHSFECAALSHGDFVIVIFNCILWLSPTLCHPHSSCFAMAWTPQSMPFYWHANPVCATITIVSNLRTRSSRIYWYLWLILLFLTITLWTSIDIMGVVVYAIIIAITNLIN